MWVFNFIWFFSTCDRAIQLRCNVKMSILFNLCNFPWYLAMSCEADKGNLECVIINDFWDVLQLIKDSDQRRLLTQALRQFVIYSRKQGQQGSYFTLS